MKTLSIHWFPHARGWEPITMLTFPAGNVSMVIGSHEAGAPAPRSARFRAAFVGSLMRWMRGRAWGTGGAIRDEEGRISTPKSMTCYFFARAASTTVVIAAITSLG